MSANLVDIQRNTQALSKIFNHLNKLDRLEVEVITILPELSDEEVLETRDYARLLGKSAWKIQAACDYQIWLRTDRALQGRGHKDVDEKGIIAAVNKQADRLGCSGRTVLNNHRIYETFQKEITETRFSSLDDKGYYLAALSAPDPHEALDLFAAKKLDSPFFLVKDARTAAKALKREEYLAKNQRAHEADDPGAKDRLAARRHFDETRLLLEQRKAACPDQKLAVKLYGAWIQDIVDQEGVWDDADLDSAIIRAWKNGNKLPEQISTAANIRLSEVKRRLKSMEGTKFQQVKQRGTDAARGGPQRIWHLIGEPFFDGREMQGKKNEE